MAHSLGIHEPTWLIVLGSTSRLGSYPDPRLTAVLTFPCEAPVCLYLSLFVSVCLVSVVLCVSTGVFVGSNLNWSLGLFVSICLYWCGVCLDLSRFVSICFDLSLLVSWFLCLYWRFVYWCLCLCPVVCCVLCVVRCMSCVVCCVVYVSLGVLGCLCLSPCVSLFVSICL